MIGAIAGDIIGSVYEHQPIKTKDFPLFQDRCTFTDDTVLTVAEAFYQGVPAGIRARVENMLTPDLWSVAKAFHDRFPQEMPL